MNRTLKILAPVASFLVVFTMTSLAFAQAAPTAEQIKN